MVTLMALLFDSRYKVINREVKCPCEISYLFIFDGILLSSSFTCIPIPTICLKMLNLYTFNFKQFAFIFYKNVPWSSADYGKAKLRYPSWDERERLVRNGRIAYAQYLGHATVSSFDCLLLEDT